jgi:phosphoserine phosphatase RsbU/P
MKKNRGLAYKLSLLILSSSAVLFFLIFGYNYLFSREIIIDNVEQDAGNLVRATVNRIDMTLRSVEKIPQNLAYLLQNSSCSSGQIIDLIHSVVANNSEVYGSTIAFEPYAFRRDAKFFAPYCYKSRDKMEFTYLGGDSYNYFHLDWYQIPKELNAPMWSEPYYDEGGGNIMMTTYTVPFYKTVAGQKRFTGVVTADISLAWLEEIVSAIKICRTGYGFLISKNGTYVTHPNKHLIMNETLFGVAEARGNLDLRETGRAMVGGGSGFVEYMSAFSGKKSWLAYSPVAASGWSLGVVFPQDELMADITRLNHTVFLLGIGGLFVLLLVIALIAGSITRPLRVLARASQSIATGNLDLEIPPVKSRDEVGRLTVSFQHMQASLKEYIERLKETTAAKERIESELKIAHDIQMSILPKIFPPFPDRLEFDIHATIASAREVGGDFYDFFLLDDDHLYFTIGDVSGKGVPAALFMAVTKTLIKATAASGVSPQQILAKVNNDLCGDNDACMFVTIFLGILNIRSGELAYSNGGHNPPFVLCRDGRIGALATDGGMALGIMEGVAYRSNKMFLGPGDAIFLYTDGITEAMDSGGDLFSEQRLREYLQRVCRAPVSEQEIVHGVVDEVKRFSAGVPQSDDITLLIVRYHQRQTA